MAFINIRGPFSKDICNWISENMVSWIDTFCCTSDYVYAQAFVRASCSKLSGAVSRLSPLRQHNNFISNKASVSADLNFSTMSNPPSSHTYHSVKDWVYNSSSKITHVVESPGSSLQVFLEQRSRSELVPFAQLLAAVCTALQCVT